MKLPFAAYPKQSLSRPAQTYCYLLVAILIVMATTQLITFEKFVPIMQNYQIFHDAGAAAKVLAGLIVISEVLALPFLLRMRLSPLMRIFSAALLLLAGLIWLGLGLWLITFQPPLIGTGITGSLLSHLPPLTTSAFGALFFAAVVGAVYLLRRDLKL